MNNRKKPMTSIGFWTEIEGDAATSVKRMPENIISSNRVIQEEMIMKTDQLSQNIYSTMIPVLKEINPESICPIDKFKYKKVCELTAPPKKNSKANSIHLSMYHVSCDEIKNMNYFFLIDEKENVAAYARFAHYEQSKHLNLVYQNLSFIAIDAIESMRKNEYALGSILVQAVFEYSLSANCEGRMSVISVSQSGEFYFKLGFTPIKESIFDELYYQGKKTDGEIMFLTNSAIEAWVEKVKLHPILETSSRLNISYDM